MPAGYINDGKDCSLTFVAHALGKVCVQGHSGLVFEVLAPRFSSCTYSDMTVNGPDALSSIMGNLVLKHKKARFVITHKLLQLQYKYELKSSTSFPDSCFEDSSGLPGSGQGEATAYTGAAVAVPGLGQPPLEQQLYVSQALLLCVGLQSDAELQELSSKLLQFMLGGMQSHLDSSVVLMRSMVEGECLRSCMDINGAMFKFEGEETKELLSLMTPLSDEEMEPLDDRLNLPQEVKGQTTPSQSVPSQAASVAQKSGADTDSG
ncbi:hypothetical protein J4Q44_G00117540 [Coregonus suidteri]|uniref:Uncharacterized protein n=1 Tax=Coregonus suidteri TaxID=861788 RepID=A0AAN8LTN0_9TELE